MSNTEQSDAVVSSGVPPWPVFVKHVLQVLSKETEVPRAKLREDVLDGSGIAPEARSERIPSGAHRAANRVDWVITHLSKAGYISAERRRGVFHNCPGPSMVRREPRGRPYLLRG